MHQRVSFLLASALLGAAASLGGCQVRQDFPEPAAGWHATDYSAVFGRLQQVPAADPDQPPTWAVRFGGQQETYGGQLPLTPGRMMAGFGGGEPVEVRGHIVGDAGGGGTGDARKGIHYEVKSIRLWSGHRE
jgi:hypothetical protein